MLQNLQLKVPPLLRTPPKRRRTAHNKRMRPLPFLHRTDKVVEGRTATGVAVGRLDEAVALDVEARFDRGGVGVDDGDDFETGAELEKGGKRLERRMGGREKRGRTRFSRRKEWSQGPVQHKHQIRSVTYYIETECGEKGSKLDVPSSLPYSPSKE